MGEFKEESEPGSPTLFVAPENFGQDFSISDPSTNMDLKNASDWDIATRYHEFKASPAHEQMIKNLRRVSASAVLRQAQAIVGSVVKPKYIQSVPVSSLDEFSEYELDLDETIDHAPWISDPSVTIDPYDLWIEKPIFRKQPLIISVDTSLSMTGEKLALTAVALAVVLIEFPDDPIGIVAFENSSKILKYPHESLTVFQLVERFLDIPAQGYTHLEDGVKTAIQLLGDLRTQGGAGARPASVILLTDGKYTAGRDPAYLAPAIGHLVVLKMGKDRSSLALCQELARLGHGSMKEVGDLESLPNVMYSLVKDLQRGKSLR